MTGPAPGSQISHYEVVSLIGKGGMGEVYRAKDTRLDRDVGIKVLTENLTRNRERGVRCERSAKLLTSPTEDCGSPPDRRRRLDPGRR